MPKYPNSIKDSRNMDNPSTRDGNNIHSRASSVERPRTQWERIADANREKQQKFKEIASISEKLDNDMKNFSQKVNTFTKIAKELKDNKGTYTGIGDVIRGVVEKLNQGNPEPMNRAIVSKVDDVRAEIVKQVNSYTNIRNLLKALYSRISQYTDQIDKRIKEIESFSPNHNDDRDIVSTKKYNSNVILRASVDYVRFSMARQQFNDDDQQKFYSRVVLRQEERDTLEVWLKQV